ncbi:MAG: putative manganese transporter [Lachnospiraceae bacterium]|jgi:ABC-type sugar transport system permease subunit|nr:putative manganese transporter [Lachnospiraceae bacterium]MEE3461493.1 putative manganese transporter [Lachnospiraceae bacterium]
MPDIISDVLKDTCIDTLKLIPFLFVTYLAMEYLERKAGDRPAEFVAKLGPLSPAAGALVGAVPQCGFSAVAASLFSGGVISAGTMIAVFLSTSDEMLPMFISEHLPVSKMLSIIGIKALIGAVSGIALDLALRVIHRHFSDRHIHDLCEKEHCGCEEEEEGGIFHAAFIHTLHITLFIFIISLVLGLLIQFMGADTLRRFTGDNPVIGVVICAIIGLIPNCAASVMITQVYLDGFLNPGQMMAGLLVSAGVGLLVLFRTNRHDKENVIITLILLGFGIFWGLLIESTGLLT